MSPLLSEAVPGWLPVSVIVDVELFDGQVEATAEVSAMGEVYVTNNTDLSGVERLTDGHYSVGELEDMLRAEGEKAWAAWCEKHGGER